MQKKSSFIVLLVVLFLFGLLFGCDNQRSVCGDGVCDFLETDVRSPYYCPLDCGLENQFAIEEQNAEMRNEYFIPLGSTKEYTYSGEPIKIQELERKGINTQICMGSDCNPDTLIEQETDILITAIEGNATMPKNALILGELVCAGEGEQFSRVFPDKYPATCCEGLTIWESGVDARFSIVDECFESGLVSGWPVGTCLNCGDGVCSELENPCNCLVDCSGGVNADYGTVQEFCEKNGVECANILKTGITKGEWDKACGLCGVDDCWDDSVSPHPICTLSDLNKVREKLDWNYVLLNDIDASETSAWNNGAGWEPIGKNMSIRFNGKFNGNNKVIKNLYINRPEEDYVGLFGYSNTAINNISLIDVNIIGKNFIGGLAGTISGIVTNSYSTGNIQGKLNVKNQGIGVGGLIGNMNKNSQLLNSYSNVNVIGNVDVGGLVGYAFQSIITNSFATGNVTKNGPNDNGGIGGLVGMTGSTTTINDCYSTGKVFDLTDISTHIGGFCGYNSGSTITNSFYDSETSGQSTSDGGVGKTTSEMKTQSTFTDVSWDFDTIWGINLLINNGYPYFEEKIIPASFTIELFDKQTNTLIDSTINKTNIGFSYSSAKIPLTTVRTMFRQNPTTITLMGISNEVLHELDLIFSITVQGYEYYEPTLNLAENETTLKVNLISDFIFEPDLNTHIISACADLNRIRDHPDWNYYLANSIDCSDFGDFNQINSFYANLDGRNNTISNITLIPNKNTPQTVALFGSLYSGSNIKNLKIKNPRIRTTKQGSSISINGNGVIASVLSNNLYENSTISNVSIINPVFDINLAGNCPNASSKKIFNLAGIANYTSKKYNIQRDGNINNSIVTIGNNLINYISRDTNCPIISSFGGIVQTNRGGISNVLFEGDIVLEGNSSVGGITTYNEGVITNSINNANLTAQTAGGISANMVGTDKVALISNSTNNGNIYGVNTAGGLVGDLFSGTHEYNAYADLTNSLNKGSISGGIDANVGGIAGIITTRWYYWHAYGSTNNFRGYIRINGACSESDLIQGNGSNTKNTIAGHLGYTYSYSVMPISGPSYSGSDYTTPSIRQMNIISECSEDCFPVPSATLDTNLCDCSGIRTDIPCGGVCYNIPGCSS